MLNISITASSKEQLKEETTKVVKKIFRDNNKYFVSQLQSWFGGGTKIDLSLKGSENNYLQLCGYKHGYGYKRKYFKVNYHSTWGQSEGFGAYGGGYFDKEYVIPTNSSSSDVSGTLNDPTDEQINEEQTQWLDKLNNYLKNAMNGVKAMCSYADKIAQKLGLVQISYGATPEYMDFSNTQAVYKIKDTFVTGKAVLSQNAVVDGLKSKGLYTAVSTGLAAKLGSKVITLGGSLFAPVTVLFLLLSKTAGDKDEDLKMAQLYMNNLRKEFPDLDDKINKDSPLFDSEYGTVSDLQDNGITDSNSQKLISTLIESVGYLPSTIKGAVKEAMAESTVKSEMTFNVENMPELNFNTNNLKEFLTNQKLNFNTDNLKDLLINSKIDINTKPLETAEIKLFLPDGTSIPITGMPDKIVVDGIPKEIEATATAQIKGVPKTINVVSNLPDKITHEGEVNLKGTEKITEALTSRNDLEKEKFEKEYNEENGIRTAENKLTKGLTNTLIDETEVTHDTVSGEVKTKTGILGMLQQIHLPAILRETHSLLFFNLLQAAAKGETEEKDDDNSLSAFPKFDFDCPEMDNDRYFKQFVKNYTFLNPKIKFLGKTIDIFKGIKNKLKFKDGDKK